MLVSDIGPRDAKILLVGEAPGAEEEKHGIPFCGPSGSLLKQMLRHAGIDFTRCYVTNVVQERPPGNKFEYFYDGKVPKKELELAWQALQKKIDLIKPEVCILFGSEALKAVTNKNGISNWRGCFLHYKDTLLMPTFHPAAVLRDYGLHPIVELDLKKAVCKKEKEWPLCIIQPTLEQVREYCEEASKGSSYVAFDIETVGKDVRCLGFAFRDANSQVKALSIPFMRFTSSDAVCIEGSTISFSSEASSVNSYWSPDQEVLVLECIAKLFASEARFCGQNSISFDEPLIWDSFKTKPKNHWIDIMHAWHLLYCEFPKGLDFINSILLCYPNYWTDKDSCNDQEEWLYNARDCVVTLEACEIIEEELKQAKLYDFYREHVHPLSQDLLRLQANGALISTSVRDEHRKRAEEKAAVALAKVKELTGEDLNPNSPKQMKELLYGKLGLPSIPNREGRTSTDEEAIRTLAKKYPGQPVLQAIIEYRKSTKLIGAFLSVATGEDGRIRTSYNASGTETGRLSSGQDLWGEGMNLQNIPAGKGLDIVNIKDMFIAPPGRLLLKGDLKQAEALVVGWILDRLGFPQMREKYLDPKFDVHRWAAAQGEGIPEDQVTKNLRNLYKLANHSGNYMSGPHVMVKAGLKYGVDIDFQTAKRLLAGHANRTEGLKEWWFHVEKTLKTTRTLVNCFGRRRVFFGRLDDSTTREAVAWEPQSTVGDLNNIILRNLFAILPDGCFPILQVHDEIVIELPEDKLDACVECYKKAALVLCEVSPKHPLIIPVELSYGRDWKNTQEVK